ncbi:hypothetical protein SDC9_95268 [bioreactor metagenome]|uniref:Uncharacterized protein n=1 Tax=bioreactor metagenome TaxID=1076179 RepID=A0A645ACG7_9ZZZZ
MEIHEGDLLHDYGVVDGVKGISSPAERAMAVDQYAGNRRRVNAVLDERLHNDIARIPLVGAVLVVGRTDLRRGHGPGAGNLPIEIVTLRGAHGGNPPSGLRKAGGPAGVGMHDASQLFPRPVQHQMGCRVAGGLIRALHHIAVQIHHHHVRGFHVAVFNT